MPEIHETSLNEWFSTIMPQVDSLVDDIFCLPEIKQDPPSFQRILFHPSFVR